MTTDSRSYSDASREFAVEDWYRIRDELPLGPVQTRDIVAALLAIAAAIHEHDIENLWRDDE